MSDPIVIAQVRARFHAVRGELDEGSRRRWAAVEALLLGRGGISAVAHATGIARRTIRAGITELQQSTAPSAEQRRIRRPGAGRKRRVEEAPELADALDALIDPKPPLAANSPLRWTCKSVRQLANELRQRSCPISPQTVATLLHENGYRLQGRRGKRKATAHADHNAQFLCVNDLARRFLALGQPIISVDTHKREFPSEPAGSCQRMTAIHPGSAADQTRPQLQQVKQPDWQDQLSTQGGTATRIDRHTVQLAVDAIRHWWFTGGQRGFPNARRLMIVAENDKGRRWRAPLWHAAFQGLADIIGFELVVSHLPSGTSKWDEVQYGLFSQTTHRWPGQPLVSHQVIVRIIGSAVVEPKTAAAATSTIRHGEPQTGHQQDALISGLLPDLEEPRGWNYVISPRREA